MVKIRVGVTGWNGATAAETIEEIGSSRQVLWVEIDGQRIDGATLTGLSGTWSGTGFHTTTVEFVGLPEFVYHGKDGVPL